MHSPRLLKLSGLLATLALSGCGDEPVAPKKPPPDGTPPRVELVSPPPDTLFVTRVGAPHRPSIQGVASDSVGVVRVTYQLNSEPEREVPVTPGTSVAFGFQLWLAEGENTLVLHAYDGAENRGTSPPLRLRQDSRGPVARLLSPEEGSTVSADTVPLRLVLTDPAGVSHVRVSVNHGATREFALSGDTLVHLDTRIALAGGENSVRVESLDRLEIWNRQSFRVNRGGLRFAQAAVGAPHRCAIAPDGSAYCWGSFYTTRGELGTGSREGSQTPVPVAGGHLFRGITAGSRFTCGVTISDAAYCWGSNSSGQLGDGSTSDAFSPVPVAGSIAFRTVSAGAEHACGVSTQDAAYCWGYSGNGRLGSAGHQQRTPTPVSGGLAFRTVSTGARHTCAVTPGGEAYCWGDNATGQLGSGSTTSSGTPTAVSGGHLFRSIHAGVAHTCALTPEGSAWCWGSNLLGELGTGSFQEGSTPVTTPAAVTGGLKLTSLAVGARHTCAVAEDGAAWCWGDNVEGQLGTGSTSGSAVPVRVAGGLVFRSIAAGGTRSCGTTTDDRLYCWGGRTLSPTPVPGQ